MTARFAMHRVSTSPHEVEKVLQNRLSDCLGRAMPIQTMKSSDLAVWAGLVNSLSSEHGYRGTIAAPLFRGAALSFSIGAQNTTSPKMTTWKSIAHTRRTSKRRCETVATGYNAFATCGPTRHDASMQSWMRPRNLTMATLWISARKPMRCADS